MRGMAAAFLFRDAWRSLTRTPRFALIVVLVLGMAVGANASVFAVLKGAVLDPWPYRGADRIVTLRAHWPVLGPDEAATFSAEEVRDLQSMTSVFEASLFGVASNVILSANGNVDRVRGASLSASAFDMLGIAPELGRTFTAEEAVPGGPSLVVISNALWRSRFAGDRTVVGRAIEIEGRAWTIVGVMPASFVFWDSQLYFPLGLDAADADRHSRRYYVQARLVPGLGAAQASSALMSLARRFERDHADIAEYRGATLAVVPLKDDVLRDVRVALLDLAGATILLLVMAVVNLSNLCLTRGSGRRREIALRAALGAGRLRLLCQFAVEGLLMGLGAAAAGSALAATGVRAMVALIPYGYLPVEAHVEVGPVILAAAAVLGVFAGLVLGVVPVFRLVTRDAIDAALLRSARVIGDRSSHRVRRALVVVQVAIALVVLSVSVTLGRSVRQLLHEPAGFDAREVDTFRVALPRDAALDRGRAIAGYQRIVERAAVAPGVLVAAASTNVPLTGSLNGTVDADGRAPGDELPLDSDTLVITPGYFAAIGVAIRSGRDLQRRDVDGAERVAVVNETFAARAWPGAEVLGRHVRMATGNDREWRTVIGLIPDLKQQSLDQPARPAVYVPLAQSALAPRTMAIVMKGSGSTMLSPAEQRAITTDAIPGAAIYQAASLAAIAQDSLGGRRLAATLFAVLGWVAAGLAVLGTAALVAFSVTERRKEIALRLALGAGRGGLAWTLFADTASLLALGALAGAVVSAGAARVTGSWVIGAGSVYAGSTMIAALIIVAGALVASALPISRAAAIDPALSLKDN